MLVFEERGKPEYPEKNLSEQGREPTTNSTHIWRRDRGQLLGQVQKDRSIKQSHSVYRRVLLKEVVSLDINNGLEI